MNSDNRIKTNFVYLKEEIFSESAAAMNLSDPSNTQAVQVSAEKNKPDALVNPSKSIIANCWKLFESKCNCFDENQIKISMILVIL